MYKDGWIAFADRMPEPSYDPKNPGPTHGMILVTNNLEAKNYFGKSSHVWLVSCVHTHEDGSDIFDGKVLAYQGEIIAYTDEGELLIRHLTHWRPALPEEWEDFR